MSPVEDGAPIQSVERAVRILELLSEQELMGVSDLARILDVHRSTAFRLLATLEGRSLVEQDGHRGAYRLGLGVLRLAGSVRRRTDLVRDAQLCCDELAERLDETTNVAIIDDGAAVNIAQAMGTQLVAVTQQYVGQRTPLHATSTGKVLLAHAPRDVREEVLEGPHERFTPSTLTEPDDVRAELEHVREQGWGAANEEWESGTCAVAVPVRGEGGLVVAAISVTAPAFRMAASTFPAYAAALREGAADLGRRLGYLAPR
ncbi:DNA-binding IclR family transcriptional regulator [Mumia flava]|uniref:Glycerol operon regulatory protein n=1 Tax=Mumia flava TaxID=1348852 RepID=A0A0B2BTI2_9ACTN|nr:IclR family transcriptional regulator [Mumia flava]PJJ57989.1 DNA-binding IclR family transcriptional regulator [Mumia flava]